MIKAPYNFVPLNEQVFFPDWADQVSHDVPFSDGESGCITIKLTAEAPIYVRNGGAWPKDSQVCNGMEDYTSFSRFDDRYFIPGTSIKGMVRSVLEILSFGKMGKGRINNHRFSFRDIVSKTETAETYKNAITEREQGAWKPQVRAGWLHGHPSSLKLTPCKFARVEQSELQTYHGNNINLNQPQRGHVKYDNWTKPLDIFFDLVTENGQLKTVHHHKSGNLWYIKARSIGSGTQTGTLVFSGQPNWRKHMEFIFYDPAQTPLTVNDQLEEDFFFIHSENGRANDDLSQWLDSSNRIRTKIPVFYLKNDDDSIHSMGLALMYRLAFDHSIHDLLPGDHKQDDTKDLAELIFGTVQGNALRGRVQFSHGFAVNDTAHPINKPVHRVLGGPKASFTPTYLEGGASYLNRNFSKSGGNKNSIHSIVFLENLEQAESHT